LKRGEEAVAELIQSIGEGKNNIQGRIETCEIDTSSDESVREAAKIFQSRHGSSAGSLYGIINNAGVRISYMYVHACFRKHRNFCQSLILTFCSRLVGDTKSKRTLMSITLDHAV
jgi:NAD(P)-dependent dehydrogenase (short-subunit alcohol dehydrogenase family)